MAGMLPGVEMHRRIRAASQRLREDTICSAHRHHRFFRSSTEPPAPAPEIICGGGDMDETAARARRRLEEKLGSYRNSRHNRVQENERRGTRQSANMKENSSHLVSRILIGRPWKSNRNKYNSSKGEICSVCLEEFGSKQQMMELNCTHKYHSECLIPWIASHPNCPSCRTPVEPLSRTNDGVTARDKEKSFPNSR